MQGACAGLPLLQSQSSRAHQLYTPLPVVRGPHIVVKAACQKRGTSIPDIARRSLLLGLGSLTYICYQPSKVQADSSVSEVSIRKDLSPDQSKYDPNDENLLEASNLIQSALNAESVQAEEAIWTDVIQKYQSSNANWMPDVVGRAYGNRGNARSRQGKMQEALSDFNQSMQLCPWSGEPVLNRGVVLEALGRFEEAVRDYRSVLAVQPNDPAAWNNLGNATRGLGLWQESIGYYGKAVTLSPEFSFAAANRALAMYQVGQTEASIREMRGLLRRYPYFVDMRAALAAALWGLGKQGDAETNWSRVDDPRYADRKWLSGERRWPPRLCTYMENFLDIQDAKQ